MFIDGYGHGNICYIHYDELLSAFLTSCNRKIRSVPVTIITPSFMSEQTNEMPLLIMSFSECLYGDDVVVFSLKIILRKNDITPWSGLIDIRDDIITLLGYRFYFSALGFGFYFNLSKMAFNEMKYISMRYLGVNLYDPLCIHSKDIIYGLRTIT